MQPTSTEIDRMLTEKEAAMLICVKPQTMSKWRMKGGNPNAPAFVTIGRNIRYKASTLRAWMDNQQDRHCNQDAA